MDNCAKYKKLSVLEGDSTAHFTASRGYTGSNGAVYSYTSSTAAAFIISGTNTGTLATITIDGQDVPGHVFNAGTIYPMAVEKVVVTGTATGVYVFQ